MHFFSIHINLFFNVLSNKICLQRRQQRNAIELNIHTAANQAQKVAMDRPHAQQTTRRGRGRSTQTWRRSMLKLLANANITWDGAKRTAQNRIRWPCRGSPQEQ